MPGHKPNGDNATTTFELSPGPQVVTTVDTLVVAAECHIVHSRHSLTAALDEMVAALS